MAILKKDEIKGMSSADIDKKISELRQELMKQNAQIATGTTPKSPGKVREIKKTIAKLLTAKKQKDEATETK